MPQDKGKQNLNESYTNKYQKHVGCSYGYKSVCVHDEFSKLFKLYLGEDAVYNFISSMTDESTYCSDVMKKRFTKELAMTKKIIKILRAQLNVGSEIAIILILTLK